MKLETKKWILIGKNSKKIILEKLVEYSFTIVIVFIVGLFSLFVGSTSSVPYAFLIAGFGLLSVGLLGCILYHLDIRKELFSIERELIKRDGEINKYRDIIPSDVETPIIESIYEFDSESLEDHKFKYIATRYFKNNMVDEKYERYKYEISSDEEVPNISDMYLEIDGVKKEINPDLSKAKKTVECYEKELCKGGSAHILLKKKSFYIYLNVPPQKTRKFSISYRNPSLKNIFDGNIEYVQISINRITDRVSLNVKITGDALNKYRLQSSNGPCNYLVYDGSEERMRLTEKKLTEKQMEPIFYDDNIIWNIDRPVIGYKYRLYFRFEER
jgi:hypothetical protein